MGLYVVFIPKPIMILTELSFTYIGSVIKYWARHITHWEGVVSAVSCMSFQNTMASEAPCS